MAAPPSALKPAVWTGGVAPAVALGLSAATGRLGADPVALALNRLGLSALLLLVAALACTPLKAALGWTWPLRVRRELGLLAFGYAAAHVLLYALVDQGADVGAIWADVVKRPFITVGALTFALLVPLAWTSTDAAVRRLGFVRWKRLHRLAYPATLLAGAHFFLRVKKDVAEPSAYLAVIAVLLVVRVATAKRPTPARGSTAS